MRGKKWATDEERREAARAAKRAYVERHPDRRAATLKAAWSRLRADPERYARFLRQCRESYARHPETGYLYALNWRGENRERVRGNNRGVAERRRERVGAARREVAEFAIVLRRDPCSYCGSIGGVIDGVVAWEGSTNWSASGEGTIVAADGSDAGRKAQNNTLAVYTHPVQIARFTDQLDHEHAVALAQQAARAA